MKDTLYTYIFTYILMFLHITYIFLCLIILLINIDIHSKIDDIPYIYNFTYIIQCLHIIYLFLCLMVLLIYINSYIKIVAKRINFYLGKYLQFRDLYFSTSQWNETRINYSAEKTLQVNISYYRRSIVILFLSLSKSVMVSFKLIRYYVFKIKRLFLLLDFMTLPLNYLKTFNDCNFF